MTGEITMEISNGDEQGINLEAYSADDALDEAADCIEAAERMARDAIIEAWKAGHLLVHAKAECEQGEWLEELLRREINPRKAQRLMLLSRSYREIRHVVVFDSVSAALAAVAEVKPETIAPAPVQDPRIMRAIEVVKEKKSHGRRPASEAEEECLANPAEVFTPEYIAGEARVPAKVAAAAIAEVCDVEIQPESSAQKLARKKGEWRIEKGRLEGLIALAEDEMRDWKERYENLAKQVESDTGVDIAAIERRHQKEIAYWKENDRAQIDKIGALNSRLRQLETGRSPAMRWGDE